MIINVNGYTTAKVWLQERALAKLTGMTGDVKLWTNLEGSASAPIATYTPTSAGEVLIDLTEYIRANQSVATFNFSFGSGSNYPLSVTIGGNINPASVIIPYNPNIGNLLLHVAPPTMMYRSAKTALAVEVRASSSWNIAITDIDGDPVYSGAVSMPSQSLTDPTAKAFTLSRGAYSFPYVLREERCGVLYADVRWVSFTGAQRIHAFEVVKVKTSVADEYSLLMPDNQYNEAKGREDSLTLRLDGLDAYDLWYYGDVVTSSKVEMSLDGTTWQRVQVTTKDITLPDGSASIDGKLEINVNWKHYDALAL